MVHTGCAFTDLLGLLHAGVLTAASALYLSTWSLPLIMINNDDDDGKETGRSFCVEGQDTGPQTAPEGIAVRVCVCVSVKCFEVSVLPLLAAI